MDKPEAARRARAMLGALCAKGIELHGALVTLDGETALEAYFAPGAAETPHRMYSVSKSFVSLAIGALWGRGLIDLDKRGADYLPELITPQTPPEARDTTLRDMLRMATCHTHRAHNVDMDYSWAAAYYAAPAAHAPGGPFGYDSTGTQVLTLLCRRLTGKTMLAFLQPTLFDPIGATGAKEWWTDPSGVEQGGSALFLTLRDLSRAACFCLTDGMGIVPAEYLRMATSLQTDTSGREGEERFGYGYQFWLMREGFAMRGMDGQMALMLPRRGLTLSTTADTSAMPDAQQKIVDAFFEHMVQ